jgi:hypothetical protein
MAYIGPYIARVIWHFDPVTEPMIEPEMKQKWKRLTNGWLVTVSEANQKMMCPKHLGRRLLL